MTDCEECSSASVCTKCTVGKYPDGNTCKGKPTLMIVTSKICCMSMETQSNSHSLGVLSVVGYTPCAAAASAT